GLTASFSHPPGAWTAAQPRDGRGRPEGGRHGQEVTPPSLGARASRTPLCRSRTPAQGGAAAALIGRLGAMGPDAFHVPLLLGWQLHAAGASVSRTRNRAGARRRLAHVAQAGPLR